MYRWEIRKTNLAPRIMERRMDLMNAKYHLIKYKFEASDLGWIPNPKGWIRVKKFTEYLYVLEEGLIAK